jgi:hypothetical protein
MNTSTEPSATLELITPEMAREILDLHNGVNRRMRNWWAMALSRAMRRGEWITTHQGIAFDIDKNLADGQHRLYAIVLANMPIQMFVFRNIDKGSFKVIDVGIKRTISDVTGLPQKSAEVARMMGAILYSGNVTAQQVLEVAGTGLDEVHGRLWDYCGTSRAVVSATPVRLAVCLLVMDGNPEADIFKTYADLVHLRYSEMSTAAQAFIRQVTEKKVTAQNHLDLLARALKALDPKQKNLIKIQVTDEERATAAKYARSVVIPLLSKGESTAAYNAELENIKGAKK